MDVEQMFAETLGRMEFKVDVQIYRGRRSPMDLSAEGGPIPDAVRIPGASVPERIQFSPFRYFYCCCFYCSKVSRLCMKNSFVHWLNTRKFCYVLYYWLFEVLFLS